MSRKARQRGILVSVLVGLGALILSWLGPLAAAHKVSRVVVATHALAAGTVLTAADVTTAAWAGPVPRGYLTAPTAAVRRVLAHDVVAGQPVLAADLQAGAAQQGLAPGQVGVMVPVTLAASGGVRPGDTVDVIWAGSTAANGNGAGSGLTPGSTLLRGARVIAVVTSNDTPVQTSNTAGQTVGGYGSTVPAAVELAVPQADASALAAAAATGTLWLVLDPWATGGSVPAPTPTPPTPTVLPKPGSGPPAAPTAAPPAHPGTASTPAGGSPPASPTPGPATGTSPAGSGAPASAPAPAHQG
ncbi:MAG: Flp pilus assembly protein CpaB [Actinomycetia bacterium]|nr:Flp pilus assembly protein CpaB [Actinomycetes bacterium]